MFMKFFITLILSIFFISSYCYAYIGPGLAIGGVILTLGIVLLIVLAFVAILYYPIKKMIKNFKNQKK